MICIQNRIKSESISLMTFGWDVMYSRIALIGNFELSSREKRDKVYLISRQLRVPKINSQAYLK